jgi:hypothetical protein
MPDGAQASSTLRDTVLVASVLALGSREQDVTPHASVVDAAWEGVDHEEDGNCRR